MIMSIAACLRSSSKDLQTFGRLTSMFRLILAMRASPISLVVYPFLSSSFFSCIVLHGLVSRTRLWVFQLVEHWGVEELEIPILNSRNQPHDRASSRKTPVTFWCFLMWGLPRIELEWTRHFVCFAQYWQDSNLWFGTCELSRISHLAEAFGRTSSIWLYKYHQVCILHLARVAGCYTATPCFWCAVISSSGMLHTYTLSAWRLNCTVGPVALCVICALSVWVGYVLWLHAF